MKRIRTKNQDVAKEGASFPPFRLPGSFSETPPAEMAIGPSRGVGLDLVRRGRKRSFSIGRSVYDSALWFSWIIATGIVAALFVTLLISSAPSLRAFGLRFAISTNWDPVVGDFGALPFLVGTLLSTLIAMVISIPFSLSIALLLGEYKGKGAVAAVAKRMIDIMAGIPSVIYGFWALFFLVPIVRSIETVLGVPPFGIGIFTSGLILSIMVIPYTASLAGEVIRMVPVDTKNGAYALGATRYEVIKGVVFPYASSGIVAGIILSIGRALGETMAVTMVIGNANVLPANIFSPGNTMASVIANEFTEATENMHLAAIVEIGLVLMVTSTVLNVIGRETIRRLAPRVKT